ncbi:hypothetical protein A4X09_0g5728 [Tilletia walkeri]|uniref:Uncharacterized protein n=1 Tax=Tilletia walkeri TaxID=117179 RepID=A0A8X7N5T0_9BASI|nr:hypothetical protein A4X09_0g5728 [Tilletia walkeri]
MQNADVTIECVFVHKGEIIAAARNRTDELLDAPSEAPSSADTSNIFQETTLMNGDALREIGFRRFVFGAGNERFGGNGSVLALHDDPALLNSPVHRSEGGYYREESIMLLRKFHMTEDTNAPTPKTKARRILKTNIQRAA